MSDLFINCCIAIVVFQAVFVALRFSLRKLQDANLTVISNCIKGALLLLLLAIRFVPQVSDGLTTAFIPVFAGLGVQNYVYLLMMLLLTCPLRMLLEQFVLKMPYKRLDWIEIGALILLVAVLFRTFLL